MRTLLLSALIVVAITAPLAAIDSSLTYQGTLEDAGAPASGTYDLEFKLQDTAGTQVGSTLAFDNVAVTAGVFTVALDFGNAAFTGPDRFLVIAVRPGASGGTYTALAPRTKVTPAPYAQLAQDANFAASVANDSIGSAQIANASILSADIADGTVASVDIADGTVGSADINSAQVQRRVASSCVAGQAIRIVAADGSVTCESATGVQGPAGPQGPAGAQGPAGPQGPAGRASTLGYYESLTTLDATASNQPFVMNAMVVISQAGPIYVTYGASVTTSNKNCTLQLQGLGSNSNRLSQATFSANGSNTSQTNSVSTTVRLSAVAAATYSFELVLLANANPGTCRVSLPWMEIRTG